MYYFKIQIIKLLNKKLIKWQYIPMQWRRKVPTSVCVCRGGGGGGGGAGAVHRHVHLCTFGKEPI